tara:strand:- start:387 stop:509 length:123 start_codon:yes stop_codon:yes gene_type:complete
MSFIDVVGGAILFVMVAGLTLIAADVVATALFGTTSFIVS